MKRRSDEENLVGTDQGCDPAGNEEDFLREARPLDLPACRSAGSAFHRIRHCDLQPAEPKRERRTAGRETTGLPGSASGEAWHDKSGSGCHSGTASDHFPLDRTICLWGWRTAKLRASIFTRATTWGRTRLCSRASSSSFFYDWPSFSDASESS